MESPPPDVPAWNTSLKPFLQAFESVDLYLALLLIGISISLALLLSILAKKSVARKLSTRRDNSFIYNLLSGTKALLFPLLSVIFLSIAKVTAESLIENASLIMAAVHLCLAWLVIRLVILAVDSKPVAWFISVVAAIYALLSATGFLEALSAYLASLSFELGRYKLSLLGVIHGVVIFVIVFWLAGLLSRLMENYLRRIGSLAYNTRELISKFFRVMVYMIAFIVTLDAIGVDLTALAVFGGALGVGVGLGLQKITANFVSGVVILVEKSIKIGDLVELENFLGWVRRLEMRYTLIETYDGREVLVPNEELLTSRVTNWTYSNQHARVEIKVPVPYEANPVFVQKLLLDVARAHPMCAKDPEPSCYLREFGDSSLNFFLFFWIQDITEGRYKPQSEVMMEILRVFSEHGLEIPYSQLVLHYKPDAPKEPQA